MLLQSLRHAAPAWSPPSPAPSGGKLAAHDLTHGLLSDLLALAPTNGAGQERRLVRVARSAPQGAWLVFSRVLSRQGEPRGMAPGQLEFSLVRDADVALMGAGQWSAPGADGAFVGGRHELLVVLSNSGRSVAVYDTAKLADAKLAAGASAKPLYVAELKEGPALALYPGPPAHIPGPPTPPPVPALRAPMRSGASQDDADGSLAAAEAGDEDGEGELEAARAAWEAQEARRLELPRTLLLRTRDNRLCLVDVSATATSYAGQARVLAARHSLALRPGEAVLQVAWQGLNEAGSGFHSGSVGAATAAAAAAAVLTNERLLLLSERLAVLAAVALPPELGPPVGCLWVGPALLVSTAGGQVVQVCWDGKLEHLAALLAPPGGGGAALLGALADRLLLCTRGGPDGDRAEVAGRGAGLLQPMLLGWASLAGRRLLPGGAERVRQELRALVGSYDASGLGPVTLERLAGAGFPDVAAALAARSDSPAITPGHRAVLRAAAGDWSQLVGLALRQWEDSTWHPKPPPAGGPLQARMVAVARACAAHGRFRDARALLEAAGAWGELLALCVVQGDFAGMQAAARAGGRDVERLADQLAAVNEDAFRRVGAAAASRALYGGRPNADDWLVAAAPPAAGAAALSGDEGSAGEDEEEVEEEGVVSGPAAARRGSGSVNGDREGEDVDLEVEVAPAGRLPFMEACLQVSWGGVPGPGVWREDARDWVRLGVLLPQAPLASRLHAWREAVKLSMLEQHQRRACGDVIRAPLARAALASPSRRPGPAWPARR